MTYQEYKDYLFVEITKEESSLIKVIEYTFKGGGLHVVFQDDLDYRYFPDAFFSFVPEQLVRDWLDAESIGKFYNTYIKQQFKQKTMGNRPNTVNKSSNQKRFIKCSINIDKLEPRFFTVDDNGNRYLNVTLHMLPDGQLDKFGNLGMITQDVPKSVREKDKEAKGAILGNAAEFERKAPAGSPTQDTSGDAYVPTDSGDDLPF